MAGLSWGWWTAGRRDVSWGTASQADAATATNDQNGQPCNDPRAALLPCAGHGRSQQPMQRQPLLQLTHRRCVLALRRWLGPVPVVLGEWCLLPAMSGIADGLVVDASQF